MAFVSTSPLGHVQSLNYSVDIVGIPAIGGDPEQTWGESKHWLSALAVDGSRVRLLLYDHYMPDERALEIKPRPDPGHQQSAEKYVAVRDRLASFGVREWSERFAKALHKQRNSAALHRRPIIFICHSTGGIVLKHALTHSIAGNEVDFAAFCSLIAFFATPHHGSGVLSDPVFARGVRSTLKLKWEMSENLRSQFRLNSDDLEELNDKFSLGTLLGIRISNYLETEESKIDVLTEAEGESLTTVSMSIVGSHSSEMSTASVPIDEEIFHIRANHMGVPKLAEDPLLRKELMEDIRMTIRSTNSDERAAHNDLIRRIFTDVKVDVHQFYQIKSSLNMTATKVWSEQVSLRSYFKSGPSEVLRRRFKPRHTHLPKPSIDIRHASDPPLVIPKATGVRRPSIMFSTSTESLRDLSPTLKATKVQRVPSPRTLLEPEIVSPHSVSMKHAFTFQAPTEQRDRFVWVHLPCNVTGWVGPVLSRIAKDKENSDLHRKILLESLWMSHHNRSRHNSPHSHFVRPYCKVLRPKETHNDELLSPSSSIEELQFTLYLPYIHWDTFRSLKARNEVIKRRTSNGPLPVDKGVLGSSSVEHKLIWQYLDSNVPIHCRRTLDQYGYPSLRDTHARDMDQVMFKRTKSPQASTFSKRGHHFSSRLHSMRTGTFEQESAKSMDTARVLMVDQLFLWILGDDSIVTFSTPKEQEDGIQSTAHLQADIRSSVLRDVNGDYARQVEDCFDHAALIVFHCVEALFEHADDPALNVFRTFEEHISETSELHTIAFKQFRDSHKIEDPKQLLSGSHSLDYSADLDNLLELRDVDDELTTIKKLLLEQRSLIASMLHQYTLEVNPRGKGLHGTSLLKEAEAALVGYEAQVEGMIRSSKVAQMAFENLLDLKQKHSNIVEAHMTRYQTEMASEQSRSVMIFTVFTIIFLPLSFFSSVFGMNVREWSGEESNPGLGYVLEVMALISLAVVICALGAAFSVGTRRVVRKVVGKVMRRLKSLLAWREQKTIQTGGRDVEKGMGRLGPSFPKPGDRSEAELMRGATRLGTDSSEGEEMWKKTNLD